MARVVISVRRTGEPHTHDLDVPAELPSEQLIPLISQSLGWHVDARGQSIDYRLVAETNHRVVLPHETLTDASIWQGGAVVFEPLRPLTIGDQMFMSSVEQPMARPVLVVESWRPLWPDHAPPADTDVQ